MIFVLALSGWALVDIANGPPLPSAVVALLAGLLAGGVTYYRLLTETGCPGCKSLRPFRRRERHRLKIRTEERKRVARNYRGPYFSFQKPYIRRERSWTQTTVEVHNVYKVRCRCASCQHEWEVEERKFVSLRKDERDLSPETHRHGRRDG
jgi:hypothetical protein